MPLTFTSTSVFPSDNKFNALIALYKGLKPDLNIAVIITPIANRARTIKTAEIIKVLLYSVKASVISLTKY